MPIAPPTVGRPPVTPHWDAIRHAAIAGMTDRELAQAFGVKQDTIRKHRVRHKWPTPAVVEKLASDMAGAESDDLNDEEEPSPPATSSPGISAEMRAIEEKMSRALSDGDGGGGTTAVPPDDKGSGELTPEGTKGAKPQTADELAAGAVATVLARIRRRHGLSMARFAAEQIEESISKGLIGAPKSWKELAVADRLVSGSTGGAGRQQEAAVKPPTINIFARLESRPEREAKGKVVEA